MKDSLREMHEKLVEDLENKKLEIVKSRLKELGYTIDFQLEASKRFKCLTSVTNGDEETVYFNNGTNDGVRVVTFKEIYVPIHSDGGQMSIGYDINYY